MSEWFSIPKINDRVFSLVGTLNIKKSLVLEEAKKD